MCGNENSCNSLTDTLCLIVKLQRQGECIDGGLQSCDRPFLGINSNSVLNTRPISFYTCPTNTLWSMPYTYEGVESESTVFRVEKVSDCCCTCRVLRPVDDTYASTDSFFTINLNCVGALRCLNDIYIPCI